jgi:WD40 repeat protein
MCRPRCLLVLVTLFAVPSLARTAAPPRRLVDLYGDRLPPGAITRLGTVRWRGVSNALTFLPDGSRLVATDGSRLVLWDARTGRRAGAIGDGIEPTGMFSPKLRAIGVSPDGKRLVGGEGLDPQLWAWPGRRPRLFVWDAASGKLLARSAELDDSLERVAIRADGRLIACLTSRGRLVLWEPATGKLRRLLGSWDSIELNEGLAFAPGGKRLVVLRDRVVHQFDLDGVVARLDLGERATAALSPDARLVTCYNPEQGLTLHDLVKGRSRRLAPPDRGGEPDGLSFGPDGRTLVVWWRISGRVQLWDVREGKLLRQVTALGLGHLDRKPRLLLSPDARTLAAGDERVIRLWDAHTGRPTGEVLGHVQAPDQLAFSPDGRALTSFAAPGDVYRWAVATGKPLHRMVLRVTREADSACLLAPGGRHLCKTRGELPANRLVLFDARTGTSKTLRDEGVGLTAVAFSPDGRTLAAADNVRVVRLWDPATGKPPRRLELAKDTWRVSGLCLTPDGKRLATGEGLHKVHLWDARTGKRLGTLSAPVREPRHAEEEKVACFSPDGRTLFTSSSGELVVWDVASRKQMGPYEVDDSGWTGAGTGALVVSPDGRLLAWFDQAQRLRLSETATGKIVHRFQGAFKGIAFAPTGWRLATACQADGSILVWDLTSLFLAQPEPRRGSLTLERLWADLADRDATRAHRAVWRLAARPGMAEFLVNRLPPVPRLDAAWLRRRLAELGSENFSAREEAERALAAAGDAAAPALREARHKTHDLEQRLRLDRLLGRLDPLSPQWLRQRRAVFALEARGTAEARRLLVRLAEGLPEARLTQEAKAAVRRLAAPAPASP